MSSKRGSLFYTIGLPRSGKSTYCDKWVKDAPITVDAGFSFTKDQALPQPFVEYHGVTQPRVIVAGDDFRLALYGHHFQACGEGHVFAAMDTATRALLNRGFDVIIDETSTTPETIKRYLRIDMDAQPVWFHTEPEECKRRALDSGKDFLIPVIDRLAPQLAHLRENWVSIIWKLKSECEARKASDICV